MKMKTVEMIISQNPKHKYSVIITIKELGYSNMMVKRTDGTYGIEWWLDRFTLSHTIKENGVYTIKINAKQEKELSTANSIRKQNLQASINFQNARDRIMGNR